MCSNCDELFDEIGDAVIAGVSTSMRRITAVLIIEEGGGFRVRTRKGADQTPIRYAMKEASGAHWVHSSEAPDARMN